MNEDDAAAKSMVQTTRAKARKEKQGVRLGGEDTRVKETVAKMETEQPGYDEGAPDHRSELQE